MVVNVKENNYLMAYNVNEGAKSLKVTDPGGNVVFDGPVDTPEQRAAMKPDILARFQSLLDSIGKGG